ncbi:SEC-C metal-binding domain-containing protein [Sorangium sp. So ce861]|uniref:YecA family protein n=1 Tax=Sorangium sp. So ce861 TaxID=3133323 RepID=UPI003F635EDD
MQAALYQQERGSAPAARRVCRDAADRHGWPRAGTASAALEDTMRLLAPLREHYHPKVQAPRQEGPSRKGPCPCGSGEKYKRCCGKTA